MVRATSACSRARAHADGVELGGRVRSSRLAVLSVLDRT